VEPRRLKFRSSRRNSGVCEVEFSRLGEFFRLMGAAAMGTVHLAGSGTGTQRFINDRLDGPCATSAFGAAAQAPIDLLGVARQLICRSNRIADVVIGNDVARTHNHGTDQLPGSSSIFLDRSSSIVNRDGLRKRKTRILKRFQSALQPRMNLSSGAGRRSKGRANGRTKPTTIRFVAAGCGHRRGLSA
jgi:hypothetical protein